MVEPLTLLGAPGSPYTRKMLALLRYRRIPYRLLIGSHRSRTDLPQPKVSLLPTFYLPGKDGALEAVVDSTPLIRRFETSYAGRAAIPPDPALRFLDELIEDFADEWLTKAMFHYRWRYGEDAAQGGEILPRWTVQPTHEAALQQMKTFIRERQISRLYVVGSNDVTAPVIEASYRRTLHALAAHLEQHAFLMGARPGASDFATYGQLTQLARFDPTPMRVTLAEAPRVFAWVDVVDDLSGLEPADADWLAPEDAAASLRPLLMEAGRTWAPVMLANARALMEGAGEVKTQVDGLAWVQQPFPYQGRCLQWLRESYAALAEGPRAGVDAALAGTGCEALFAP